jgi:hypothetical protein
VKTSVATNASATVPTKPKTGLSLFGDDIMSTTTGLGDDMDDIDLDAAIADVEDDWIIDDVGGGLRDEPEAARGRDGFVKEMGTAVFPSVTVVSDMVYVSEHHESTTAFPGWIHTFGKQKAIPW